ncbi:MAG: hypothetical protein IJE45_05690 [Bacilli bacterium]|nr:hypothetical protein [Bacilli bacterium]
MNKKKFITSMVFNGLIIILGIIGFILSIIKHGFGLIQYYTQLSNIFLLGVTIALFVYQILYLKKGLEIPRILKVLKYSATCMVSITLIVVIFILIPMAGFEYTSYMLFEGTTLYYHTLCPLLAVLSFFILDEIEFEKKDKWYAFLPTVAYGIVIVFFNLIKVIKGPYGFLYIYENPIPVTIIWGIVILGFSYLLCIIFKLIKSKVTKIKR